MLIQREPGTTRIVICGEVSSGKSTVLNCLLRERLLPDNLGAPVRPYVAARWAPSRRVQSAFPDGTILTPEFGDHEALRGADRILIHSSARHVKSYEFLELPLTTADELTDDHFALVRSADVLIWVTIASQAWRLTEQRILDELETVIPGRTILAISRADKLRTRRDSEKLMARIEAETMDYFDAAHFVHGTRDLVATAGKSRQAWEETGGAAIMDRIEELMARPSARGIGEGDDFSDATSVMANGHNSPTGVTNIHHESGLGSEVDVDCVFRSVRAGEGASPQAEYPS
ncbi:dynamin family protein [Mesobacterium pallidum]|uniref:dynamin family protein n=1 Tax=Mesobacterium pallidum TaxID=2872037 RepID=UPI001EE22F4E|nr:dynamin family protein [Mesobacterium pallidum]